MCLFFYREEVLQPFEKSKLHEEVEIEGLLALTQIAAKYQAPEKGSGIEYFFGFLWLNSHAIPSSTPQQHTSFSRFRVKKERW